MRGAGTQESGGRTGSRGRFAATAISTLLSMPLAVAAPSLVGPGPLPVGDSPDSVVVADFDRDGAADLASADRMDDRISILFGDAAGGFRTAVAYGVGRRPTSLVAVDIDRDGDLDLLAVNTLDNT